VGNLRLEVRVGKLLLEVRVGKLLLEVRVGKLLLEVRVGKLRLAIQVDNLGLEGRDAILPKGLERDTSNRGNTGNAREENMGESVPVRKFAPDLHRWVGAVGQKPDESPGAFEDGNSLVLDQH
jgi:hypothetical protein